MQDYLKAFLEGKVGALFGSVGVSPASNDSSTPADQPLLFDDVALASNAGETPALPSGRDTITNAAQAVLDAGLAVYKYYHQVRKQRGGELNASLYDIKLYFKGRNEKGNMNATSTDEHFNTLMDNLRLALQALAKQIEPKVYQYGFLK